MPTKKALIEDVVKWRQEAGGSVSPHNHRRLLTSWSKSDVLELWSKIFATRTKEPSRG